MDILLDKADGILTIEFNRPDKKNAITAAMYLSMTEALKDAHVDPTIRAILFIGKPEIFSAGNDLEDFLKHPPTGADSPVLQFLSQISHASKPMIAAVSGAAVGIGTTMLLHCDLAYASDSAKFSTPFAQLGLCPEAASSMLLPQLAGHRRAAEMLMLGEAITAQEAQAIGLINKIVPADQLHQFARAQAGRLVALPATSLRITKQLMKQRQTAMVEACMSEEIKHFAAMLKAPEAQEAFKAFFEKRKPDFRQFD